MEDAKFFCTDEAVQRQMLLAIQQLQRSFLESHTLVASQIRMMAELPPSLVGEGPTLGHTLGTGRFTSGKMLCQTLSTADGAGFSGCLNPFSGLWQPLFMTSL